jgi:signal transduction histidine kinase
LETVFDKFVQSSKTKTGAGGTGLGLAICREIVAAHGGTIRAEQNPAPQAGVCFVVRLPVRPEAARAGPAPMTDAGL